VSINSATPPPTYSCRRFESFKISEGKKGSLRDRKNEGQRRKEETQTEEEETGGEKGRVKERRK
jgi:hypothetical protein